jgi:RluA family pseudouridine synthase
VRRKENKGPEITILHQDEDILVVNKPAGVLVIPDRAGRGGILRLLRAKLALSDEQELRLVHRIDRDTSGALLIARHIHAQRALVEQFQKRRIVKKYLALVAGQPGTEGGTIDQRIAAAGRAGRYRVDPAGKRAITKWRVVRRFAGFCLLECRPVTGRTHQIRVHLQHAGLPLAVDPVYGGGESLRLSQFKSGYKRSTRRPETPLIRRLTLHAHSLRFAHPAAGQVMQVEAPLPDDLARALRQLQKYGMK